MTIFEKMGRFICAEDHIPKDVEEKAVDYFIDTFGCMILGNEESVSKKGISYVKENSAKKEATVYCRNPFLADVEYGAFANGVFAHSCDFDDMSESGCGHPSIPVFPVVLALGELGGKSGREMLKAYIKGMEVSMRMGGISKGKEFGPGWNPTTAIGIFGAAAAASVLMGLDEKQTAAALSLAADEAGGTKGNYGAEGKNIPIGRLGMKAIGCAKLGRLGIQVSDGGMEGENGYLKCFTGRSSGKEILNKFARSSNFLMEPGIIQKTYPTCRSNHNAIDGGIFLHDFSAGHIGEIEKIQCIVDQPSANLDLYERPDTPEQAKFSLPYCLALALLYGEIKPELFLSQGEIDQRAKALSEKITVGQREQWQIEGHFINEVKIYFKDGKVKEYLGAYGKGHPKNPFTDGEKYEKFKSCLKGSFKKDKIPEIYSQLKHLADCKDYRFIRDKVVEGLQEMK